jgi:hypothetical protein
LPANVEPYLVPYVDAARQHGGAFRALLWASPKTQRARFAAIVRAVRLDGRVILDAGCGRADFMKYLLDQKIKPFEYVGLEAVDALAQAAVAANYENARILGGDFVSEPLRFCVGAEVIVFSGSLNTLPDDIFYQTLRHAFTASGEEVVFNYLSSPALAGKEYLYWRSPEDVVQFARTLSGDVEAWEDYLHGDCTVVVRKKERVQGSGCQGSGNTDPQRHNRRPFVLSPRLNPEP